MGEAFYPPQPGPMTGKIVHINGPVWRGDWHVGYKVAAYREEYYIYSRESHFPIFGLFSEHIPPPFEKVDAVLVERSVEKE